MNILPKKRWHVRTKENIARVRKDEAEAAEKEKQEKIRIENADREARLQILKNNSKAKLESQTIVQKDVEPPTSKHINLFEEFDRAVQTTNKDYDKEKKDKKEEYEKKIGYLTYLGQDTNEALKKRNWYEVLPESSRFSKASDIKDTYERLVLRDKDGKVKAREIDIKNDETAWKAKQSLDPLQSFKKHCSGHAQSSTLQSNSTSMSDKQAINNEYKINKKNKHNVEDKAKKLQKLREARLKREETEKYKTKLFLSKQHSSTIDDTKPESPKIIPKYNSQFNPHIARQNYRT